MLEPEGAASFLMLEPEGAASFLMLEPHHFSSKAGRSRIISLPELHQNIYILHYII
jgi:hypothetical protein